MNRQSNPTGLHRHSHRRGNQNSRLRRTLTGIAVFVLALGAIVAPQLHPSTAEAVTYKNMIGTYYAYLKPGETLETSAGTQYALKVWDQDGTLVRDCPLGVNCAAEKSAPATDAGVWIINADSKESNQVLSMKVFSGSSEITGRVWGETMSLSNRDADALAPNVKMYFLSQGGVQYEASYGAWIPFTGRIQASNRGVMHNDGSCTSVYASVPSPGRVEGIHVGDRFTTNAPECLESGKLVMYRVFFNEKPATDMPLIAEKWGDHRTLAKWVLPEYQVPEITDLTFVRNSYSTSAGNIVGTLGGQPGDLTFKVDADNDGQFNGPEDVSWTQIAGLGEFTQPWDGLTKSGKPVPISQPFNVQVQHEGEGEIHFIDSDVEGRANGLRVTALNGPEPGPVALNWDDATYLPAARATTVVKKKSDPGGEDGSKHAWAFAGTGWGDVRVIEDWTRPVTSVEAVVYPVPMLAPAVSLVKTAALEDPDTFAAGERVTYTFEIINTGNTPLEDLTITETEWTGTDALSVIDCLATTVDVDDTVTCTATYKLTQADVDRGSVTNRAQASGVSPTGVSATSPEDEAILTGEQTPSIRIEKTADVTEASVAGTPVTYHFIVENTGNVSLTDVAVTELPTFNGSGEISAVTCDDDALAPTEFTRCTATYEVTQADLNAGADLVNEAQAVGTPPAGDAVTSEPDAATVELITSPAISLVKTANRDQVTVAGDTVTYSFEVTNTGNVDIDNVTIEELPSFNGSGELSDVSCDVTSLAPSHATTCQATYEVTQADLNTGTPLINEARAHGTDPASEPITSADSTATVRLVPGPALELTKSVDVHEVSAVGETVNYSFAVTNTGNVDLTEIAIEELPTFNGSGELSDVTCEAAALAPNAATTCQAMYTVTQGDFDAGVAINNEARATGVAPAGEPTNSEVSAASFDLAISPSLALEKTADRTSITTAGDDVTYSFAVTNTGNQTLTGLRISEDAFNGASPIGAVDCPADSLAPEATITCTATYTVTKADLPAAGTTSELSNTATAHGTASGGAVISQPSTATVTLAPPVPPVVPPVDPPTTPQPDGKQPPTGLPNTGSGMSLLPFGAAALMLLAGSVLAFVALRRRSHGNSGQ